jgi:transposase-like protein
VTYCPACGHDTALYLGRLGRLTHLRCRACGMVFNTEEEIDTDE